MAWPNPAHDKTEIDFDSEQPGWVRLDVFDLQGRMVKQLVHKYMGQGPQKVTWDLSNQMGRPSGRSRHLSGQACPSKIRLSRLKLWSGNKPSAGQPSLGQTAAWL
ncbi:MAG: hypothetical protein M9948_06390 [Lentimicrobium sp.]|nr:hypothetical protein [Lentimicrobium sp.]